MLPSRSGSAHPRGPGTGLSWPGADLPHSSGAAILFRKPPVGQLDRRWRQREAGDREKEESDG
jgi:hypothetical protein